MMSVPTMKTWRGRKLAKAATNIPRFFAINPATHPTTNPLKQTRTTFGTLWPSTARHFSTHNHIDKKGSGNRGKLANDRGHNNCSNKPEDPPPHADTTLTELSQQSFRFLQRANGNITLRESEFLPCKNLAF